MPLVARLTIEQQSGDRRRSIRRTLKLEVPSSLTGDAPEVLIHNLSHKGLLIETAARLKLGEIIEVDLPEVGLSAARIVRFEAGFFGCEFVKPVSKAAVSAALLRAPIEPPAWPDMLALPPDQLGFAGPAVLPSVSAERLAQWEDQLPAGASIAERAGLAVALIVMAAVVAFFVYALYVVSFSA